MLARKGGVRQNGGGLSRNGGLPYYIDVFIFPLLTKMYYKIIA